MTIAVGGGVTLTSRQHPSAGSLATAPARRLQKSPRPFYSRIVPSMATHIRRNAKSLFRFYLAPLLCLCFITSHGLSQETSPITSTTGLGDLGTTVTSHDHTIQITGGSRQANGTSLFHSFHQFNIGQQQTAQFLNTTPSLPTTDILARVTGGTPSSIFGTIDTTSYPGANLFLMNPAGIVFGPNASLNLGGSVTFTTADYLRLAEGNGSNSGIFHAAPTETSLLTSAPVTAFGFLNSNTAAIAVQGSTITVQPGESITLIGGKQGFTYIDPHTDASTPVPGGVTITSGHLVAGSGQVNIASVASQGEMHAKPSHQTSSANGQNLEVFGPIQISQQSSLETSGESGGSVRIRGGHLLIDSSTLSSRTGEISIESASMRITNAAEVTTEATAAANAGHITLNAQRDIALDSGARILSSSRGSSGHAGNITVQSDHGNIFLSKSASLTSYSEMGSGNTGSITLDAPHGTIHANDAFVYTSAQGTGTLGGIQITANNLLMQDGASISGNNFTAQIAEPIIIRINHRLTLTGNSIIETATPQSANAADLIVRSREVALTEHSALSTITTSSGDAGRLSLFTDHLQVTDGARILSGSLVNPLLGEIPAGRGGAINIKGFTDPDTTRVRIAGSDSGIFTDTHGSGAAGDLHVKATSMILQDGGTISATTTGTSHTATGGSISVHATDQVTLTNGASIRASSTGPAAGNAGNISLDAGQQLDMTNGSSITTATESSQANGGNIDIRAIDRIQVVDSTISTSVLGAEGNGGNIFIDPKVVVLQGSDITAKAVGGAGGNITFVTPLFLADSTSLVSASSQRGPSGTVTIQSPTSNLSGAVGQLVSKIAPAQVLIQNRCVAATPGTQSTFILAGRDALPDQPGGWLSSPVAMEHWTQENTEGHASGLMVRSIQPNQSPAILAFDTKGQILSLRRLTPPGFLVRTFSTPSTGCSS